MILKFEVNEVAPRSELPSEPLDLNSWVRLDFRRLPGPVFDPPRGMSAGSFSRTAAGNRAYSWVDRGLTQIKNVGLS